MDSMKEWIVYKDEKRKLSKQKETLMTGETIWFGNPFLMQKMESGKNKISEEPAFSLKDGM